MISKLIRYPVVRKKLNVSAESGNLYQVLLEHNCTYHPEPYIHFFESFYTIYSPKNPYDYISFEFHANRSRTGVYTWLSGGISKEFLQSNLNSVHPYAEIKEIKKKRRLFKTITFLREING